MLIKAIRQFELFAILIGLFFIILCFHAFFIINAVEAPVPLVYGPMLLFIYRSSNEQKIALGSILLHIVPLCVFSIFFVLDPTAWYKAMQLPYMLVVFCSSLVYPLFVLIRSAKNKIMNRELKRTLFVEKLALLGMAVSFFLFLMLINTISPMYFDVDPMLVIFAIMLISMGIIFWYACSSSHKKKQDPAPLIQQESPSINLPSQVISIYKEKLHQSMINDQLYLDANLSLDNLSLHVQIPKHQISYLINTELSSNFYEWVARYRIAYAVQLLNNGSDNLKLEFLANLCGFNSRTSFIRYFKQFNGVSPSEFRNNLGK